MKVTKNHADAAATGKRVARTNRNGEARHLFEKQLIHVRLRMPKTATQITEVVFEMPMQTLMANMLATGLLGHQRKPGPSRNAATATDAASAPCHSQRRTDRARSLRQRRRDDRCPRKGSVGARLTEPSPHRSSERCFRQGLISRPIRQSMGAVREGRPRRNSRYKTAMNLIANNDGPLPPPYKDHALTGEFAGCRDCHVHGDHLLIYRIFDDGMTVVFVDMGTHSELSRK